MASALRPTPDTGRESSLAQRPQSIGPSWNARGGRNARLAMRDMIRKGDRKGAAEMAVFAEEKGLPANATIGSAESRMASSYRQDRMQSASLREMDAALAGKGTPEASDTEAPDTEDGFDTATNTPTGESRQMPYVVPKGGRPPASRTAAGLKNTTAPPTGTPAQPPPPPPPGASQVPENPVSGAVTPVTGDVRERLASRGTINGKPVAAKKTPEDNAEDFTNSVQELVTNKGMFRKDAIDELNLRRRESGKPNISSESVISRLQGREKVAFGDRVAANTETRLVDQWRPPEEVAEPARKSPPPPAAAPTVAPKSVAQQTGETLRKIAKQAMSDTTRPIRRLAGEALGRGRALAAIPGRALDETLAPVTDAMKRAKGLRKTLFKQVGEVKRTATDLRKGFVGP